MSDWRDFKSVRVAENEWMAFTDSAARFIHRQVLELGYRHHPELQTHRFVGGSEGQLGGLTMKWQEADASAPLSAQEAPVPDISGLSLAQKTDLAQQLKRDGVGGFGAPGPAEPSDVLVVESVLPGDRVTDGSRVRQVEALDGEWVRVSDPESGWVGRMKRSTVEGWDRL